MWQKNFNACFPLCFPMRRDIIKAEYPAVPEKRALPGEGASFMDVKILEFFRDFLHNDFTRFFFFLIL